MEKTQTMMQGEQSPVEPSRPDPPSAPEVLTPEALARLVNQTDPRAFLVAPRVLWRVIKYCRGVPGWGLQIPHRKTFVLPREELEQIVEPDELLPRRTLPEVALLLAAQETEELQQRPREQVLLEYWRLLFHAQVHAQLQEKIVRGELSVPKVRQRIHHIGQTEFDEVRQVLRSEELLLPPLVDVNVYVEFAAVFLELRWFEPQLLPRYFPSVVQWEHIEQVLAQDVDAQELFQRSRLPGAPEPQAYWTQSQSELPEDSEEAGPFLRAVIRVLDLLGYGPGPRLREDPRRYHRLLEHAVRQAQRGNHVQAAIQARRAAYYGTAKRNESAIRQAREYLDHLVWRLQQVVEFSNEEAQRWRSVLWALLDRAAQGVWTAEARLMYDLQKLCVDRQQVLYRFRLWRWVRTAGREPLREPMPLVSQSQGYRHLEATRRRLPWIRVSEPIRRRLRELLDRAQAALQRQLRPKLHRAIAQSLQQGGLVPDSLAEEVAQDKIAQELVDEVLHRGHMAFADLRDAVARNQLKIPDLQGPQELWAGDPLLRTDALLAQALPGIYRRAEVYLRAMQRTSAVLFGTPWGRWLMRYVALPFGGAYAVLYTVLLFASHLIELAPSHPQPEPSSAAQLQSASAPGAEHATAHHGPEVPWLAVLVFGALLVLLINSESFRQGFVYALRLTARGIRWLARGLVRWLGLVWLARLLASREVRAMWRYLFKPAAFTLLVWALMRWSPWPAGAQWHSNPLAVFALFLVWNMVLNSRWGRDAEEYASQWLVRSWRRVWGTLLVGMFYLVVDFFRAMLEAVDRALYAVDQWLRFQQGETSAALGLKLLGSTLWGGVNYVIRFAITLLIEPQINPLKHFPVVTVSHKLLIPLAPFLAEVLLRLPWIANKNEALAVALGIIFCIPGIFGFLAWELKENWRLYEANRPRGLRPAVVGHHGETMIRLMRPGVHSGTLPKLYRKLRRAARKAALTGKQGRQRKLLQALEQVQHRIALFVERELAALLHRSRAWVPVVEVGQVHIGSNRIRVELRCAEVGPEPTWLIFEEQSGWLLGSLSPQGWWQRLDEHSRVVFRNAVVGLYKLAGVDLVREQIQAAFPWPEVAYDIDQNWLVIWPSPDYACEARYELDPSMELLVPWCEDARLRTRLPVLERREVFFSLHELLWTKWRAYWDQLQQRPLETAALLPEVPILPAEVHPGKEIPSAENPAGSLPAES